MTTKEKATKSQARILIERYLALTEEAERAQKALKRKDAEHRALLDKLCRIREKLNEHVGPNVRRQIFQFGNQAVTVRWNDTHPVVIDITTLE